MRAEERVAENIPAVTRNPVADANLIICVFSNNPYSHSCVAHGREILSHTATLSLLGHEKWVGRNVSHVTLAVREVLKKNWLKRHNPGARRMITKLTNQAIMRYTVEDRIIAINVPRGIATCGSCK